MYSILNDRCSDLCSFYTRIFCVCKYVSHFMHHLLGLDLWKLVSQNYAPLIRLFCQLRKLELVLLKLTVRESTIVFWHFFVLSRELKLCRADMHNRSRHNLMSRLDTQILLVTSSNLKVSSELPDVCLCVWLKYHSRTFLCIRFFN